MKKKYILHYVVTRYNFVMLYKDEFCTCQKKNVVEEKRDHPFVD